jgi:hypothetical protein
MGGAVLGPVVEYGEIGHRGEEVDVMRRRHAVRTV